MKLISVELQSDSYMRDLRNTINFR